MAEIKRILTDDGATRISQLVGGSVPAWRVSRLKVGDSNYDGGASSRVGYTPQPERANAVLQGTQVYTSDSSIITNNSPTGSTLTFNISIGANVGPFVMAEFILYIVDPPNSPANPSNTEKEIPFIILSLPAIVHKTASNVGDSSAYELLVRYVYTPNEGNATITVEEFQLAKIKSVAELASLPVASVNSPFNLVVSGTSDANKKILITKEGDFSDEIWHPVNYDFFPGLVEVAADFTVSSNQFKVNVPTNLDLSVFPISGNSLFAMQIVEGNLTGKMYPINQVALTDNDTKLQFTYVGTIPNADVASDPNVTIYSKMIGAGVIAPWAKIDDKREVVPIDRGGTNASTIKAARTNLELQPRPGSNSVSANFQITVNHSNRLIVVDTRLRSVTVTLPNRTLFEVENFRVFIKHTNGINNFTCTIRSMDNTPIHSTKIGSSFVLRKHLETVELQLNGSTWHVISGYNNEYALTDNVITDESTLPDSSSVPVVNSGSNETNKITVEKLGSELVKRNNPVYFSRYLLQSDNAVAGMMDELTPPSGVTNFYDTDDNRGTVLNLGQLAHTKGNSVFKYELFNTENNSASHARIYVECISKVSTGDSLRNVSALNIDFYLRIGTIDGSYIDLFDPITLQTNKLGTFYHTNPDSAGIYHFFRGYVNFPDFSQGLRRQGFWRVDSNKTYYLQLTTGLGVFRFINGAVPRGRFLLNPDTNTYVNLVDFPASHNIQDYGAVVVESYSSWGTCINDSVGMLISFEEEIDFSDYTNSPT